jgi:hypothetical protein
MLKYKSLPIISFKKSQGYPFSVSNRGQKRVAEFHDWNPRDSSYG